MGLGKWETGQVRPADAAAERFVEGVGVLVRSLSLPRVGMGQDDQMPISESSFLLQSGQ